MWYSLPSPASVSIAIYDLLGRRIGPSYLSEFQAAGPHALPIEVKGVSPGVYLCRVVGGAKSATLKLIVVR